MHAKFTDMHRNFMGKDQIFSAAGMKRLRGTNSNVLPQHNALLLLKENSLFPQGSKRVDLR